MPSSSIPHGAAIERAMSAAMEAISALPDDGDNVLLLNTIEGESDVLEVLGPRGRGSHRGQEAGGTRERTRETYRSESRACPRRSAPDNRGVAGQPAGKTALQRQHFLSAQAAGHECR